MTLHKLITLLTASTAMLYAASSQGNDHVPGRLLAQPRLGANPTGVGQALAKAGARLEKTLTRINVHVLQVPEPALDRVADALMQSGMFTFVERDYTLRPSAAVTPNDPYFTSQWHLN